MRTPLALLLAAIVALSSVTMAGARHQPRTAGQVTLCTGFGLVAVAVDRHGEPVGPMLPCPDCIAPALAAMSDTAGPAAPELRLVPAGYRRSATAPPDLDAPGFNWSRGPPAQA